MIPSDSATISKLVAQDDYAFGVFYEQTVQRIGRFLVGAYNVKDPDMQDILWDIYLKIRNGLPKYKPDHDFVAYIWTIVRNHCKDVFKGKKYIYFGDIDRMMGDGDELISYIDTVADTKQYYDDDDQVMDSMNTDIPQNILLDYLSKLDDLTRECIYARYVLWYEYNEIAALHGLSPDNARQKISRWIKHLRVHMDELK